MIGKVYKCPKDVADSGQIIVVARDPCHNYNASRKPWFLQVREYKDGEALGTWIPVTLREFMKWNPDVIIPEQWRNSS